LGHKEDDKQECGHRDDIFLLHHNSVEDGSWGKFSSADSKIITLTTQVNNLKAQLQGASAGETSSKDPKQVAKLAGKGDTEPSNK
jgi:hypothetical protein